jgi:hypothetical protein
MQHDPLATKLYAVKECLMRTDDDDEDIFGTSKPQVRRQKMDTEANQSKSHHEKELASKDREITSLKLRCELLSAKRQEDEQTRYSTERLEVELAQEKSYRLAAEKKAKEDISALTEKHKAEVAQLAIISEKQLNEKWQERQEKEKRRMEQEAEKMREKEEKEAAQLRDKQEKEKQKIKAEAAMIRDKQEKQEQAKLARRNELLVKAKKHNAGIQSLLYRDQDGTLPLTKQTEIPSKQVCLDGLTDLWAANRDTIVRMLPHELMNDHDFALEFEVDIIVTARIYMLTLKLWGFASQELLATGWSPTAMYRLMYGLYPYQFETPLSTLSVAVRDVYRMLQEVATNIHAPPMPPKLLGTTQPYVSQPPSVTLSQATPSKASQHGINGSTVVNAQSLANQASLGAYQDFNSYLPTVTQVSTSVGTSSVNSATSKQPSQPSKPCFNMAKNGFCKFGDKCKFSHDGAVVHNAALPIPNVATGPKTSKDVDMTDAPLDLRSKKPCNNVKKFGFCKRAECPFLHPPGQHTSTGPIPNVQSQDPSQTPAINYGIGQALSKIDKPCWNERNGSPCTKPNCRFTHHHPHTSTQPTSFPPPKAPGVTFQTPNPSANKPTKPCWNERNTGHCTKPNCQFAHSLPHGALANPSNMSIRGQALAQQQPHNQLTKPHPGMYLTPQLNAQLAHKAREQVLLRRWNELKGNSARLSGLTMLAQQGQGVFSKENVFQGGGKRNGGGAGDRNKNRKRGHGHGGQNGGNGAFGGAGGNVFRGGGAGAGFV